MCTQIWWSSCKKLICIIFYRNYFANTFLIFCWILSHGWVMLFDVKLIYLTSNIISSITHLVTQKNWCPKKAVAETSQTSYSLFNICIYIFIYIYIYICVCVYIYFYIYHIYNIYLWYYDIYIYDMYNIYTFYIYTYINIDR